MSRGHSASDWARDGHAVAERRRDTHLRRTKTRSTLRRNLARPAGFEPATRCLEGSCSIRLSYGRPVIIVHGEDHTLATRRSHSVAPHVTDRSGARRYPRGRSVQAYRTYPASPFPGPRPGTRRPRTPGPGPPSPDRRPRTPGPPAPGPAPSARRPPRPRPGLPSAPGPRRASGPREVLATIGFPYA